MSETLHLAEMISSDFSQPHYLVLNAGMVRGRRTLTTESLESNFALNYLSRFALATRLLPLLQRTGRPGASARILLVAGAVRGGKIYFDDVNLTQKFSTLRMVLQFNGANDVFTLELARRLGQPATAHTVVTCLKLGVIKTNIRQEFPLWMKLLVPLVFDPLLGQSPFDAAQSALELLLDPNMEGVSGALFQKIKRLKQILPTDEQRSQEAGQRLFELSESLIERALHHGRVDSAAEPPTATKY